MTLAGRVDKISSKGDSHAPKIKAEVDLLEAEVASLLGGWPSVVGVSVSGKNKFMLLPSNQPCQWLPTQRSFRPLLPLDHWGDLPDCYRVGCGGDLD